MATFKGHRWFAAIWDRIGDSAREVRADIAGGAPGRVLEVGAGTGFNFPYFRGPHTVVAVEPDPHMVGRALRRAQRLGVDVAIQQATAENLPFEDASFDTVVSTLVMCSVADPDRAFQEIRRVLKPGGELRFYEHVRSASRVLSLAQDAITPVTRWLGAGCHQNRDTVGSIRKAGFDVRRLDRLNMFEVKGVAVPVGERYQAA